MNGATIQQPPTGTQAAASDPYAGIATPTQSVPAQTAPVQSAPDKAASDPYASIATPIQQDTQVQDQAAQSAPQDNVSNLWEGIKQSMPAQTVKQIWDAVQPPQDAREHALAMIGGTQSLAAYRVAKQLVDSAEATFKAPAKNFQQAKADFVRGVQDFHNKDYRNSLSDAASVTGDMMDVVQPGLGLGTRVRDLSEGARPGGNLVTPITQDIIDAATLRGGEAAPEIPGKITGAVPENLGDVIQDMAGTTPVRAEVGKEVGARPLNESIQKIQPTLDKIKQDVAKEGLQGQGVHRITDFINRLDNETDNIWKEHTAQVTKAIDVADKYGIGLGKVKSLDVTLPDDTVQVGIKNRLLSEIDDSAKLVDPEGAERAEEWVNNAFKKDLDIRTADDMVRRLNAELKTGNTAWGGIETKIREQAAAELRQGIRNAVGQASAFDKWDFPGSVEADAAAEAEFAKVRDNLKKIDEQWGAAREVSNAIHKRTNVKAFEDPEQVSLLKRAAQGVVAGAPTGGLVGHDLLSSGIGGLLGGTSGIIEGAIENVRARNAALSERLNRALTRPEAPAKGVPPKSAVVRNQQTGILTPMPAATNPDETAPGDFDHIFNPETGKIEKK